MDDDEPSMKLRDAVARSAPSEADRADIDVYELADRVAHDRPITAAGHKEIALELIRTREDALAFLRRMLVEIGRMVSKVTDGRP